MTGETRDSEGGEASARPDTLSPRRLVILTGAFVLAVAFLLALQWRADSAGRRTETELRVRGAASDCAAGVDVAIMTGSSIRETLARCHPGGRAALFHLSPAGDILTAYGVSRRVDIDPSTVRTLPLGERGEGVLDLASGEAAAAWRPLDNGDAMLVAAPRADIFARTPTFVTYLLILAAVALVVGSLVLAFLRQSRAALEAAGAVAALKEFSAALAGGRCSPWRYDPKERTVTMTRALLEPLGLGARDRQFSLREITALTHPDDLRAALAIFTGEPSGVSEGQVRFREPGGAWSRVYLRTAPDATRFRRAGVAFDLSGGRALAPTAQLAEARLKDAIEAIPDAFVLWDAHGRLALWNRRFASVFRFPERALQPGLTAAEAATLAAARGDLILQYFAPDAPIDEQSVEVSLPGDRWVHVSRRRTAEGGLVCLASNVTDVKRRARAHKKKERDLKTIVADLQSSRAELSETMRKYEIEKHRAEEASRSKSEFLANMSHELRTPLNAINGFTEIMQAELYGPIGDAKYKEYIGDILSSGRHLLELIDDILDMSKIEAGRIELEPKRVEIEKALSESVRLVAKRAADAGVKLTASVGHAPAAWADARAVKQVTLNLLSNAIKFTPRGGEVTITAEADLDGVTVIVADSGAGIDKGRLSKLGAPFEQPFEQSGDYFAKPRQGSGIGLALSRALMELQGGILAIASQPGKGTVACATFPRRKDAKVRLPQFVRREAHVLTGPRPAEMAAPPPPYAAPEAAE